MARSELVTLACDYCGTDGPTALTIGTARTEARSTSWDWATVLVLPDDIVRDACSTCSARFTP